MFVIARQLVLLHTVFLLVLVSMAPARADRSWQAEPGTFLTPKSDASETAPYITDFSKPFNEYSWITVHNAYQGDMGDQLNRGMRGFMLDLHPGLLPDNEVYLCHPIPPMEECDNRGSNGQKFSDALKNTFIPFLKNNPDAVITLHLENYVSAENIEKAFNSVPEIESYIFNPMLFTDSRNSLYSGGSWPTLRQIIESGRRIIILDQRSESSKKYNVRGKEFFLLYDQHWSVENKYDLGIAIFTHDWDCTSRWGGSGGLGPEAVNPGQPQYAPPGEYFNETLIGDWKRLFVMNQFHSALGFAPDAASVDNDMSKLYRRVYKYCKEANTKYGLAAGDSGTYRQPNYIAIDHYKQSTTDLITFAATQTMGGIYFFNSRNANMHKEVICALPAGRNYYLRLKEMSCNKNTAKSLLMTGVKKGTQITLLDDRSENYSDDYATIYVKRDISLARSVVVDTFEKEFSDNPDYRIVYVKNTGLDGSVSVIHVEQNVPEDNFVDSRIVLHKGYNATGGVACTLDLKIPRSFSFKGSANEGCENNAAKSARILKAKAGTKVTLHDNKNVPDPECEDGCTEIHVKQDIRNPITIDDLDRSWSNNFVAVKNIREKIAGKVSSVDIDAPLFGGANVFPRSTLGDGHWGNWASNTSNCPSGQFVWGFRLKSERTRGNTDDTALNAVQLYCSRSAGASPITSREASWQDHTNGPVLCSESDGPVNGFSIRIEPRLKGGNDDTAAGNVRMVCRNAGRVLGVEPAAQWGNWSPTFKCPVGEAAIGFITRVEPDRGSYDDTALNGMRLLCGPYKKDIAAASNLRATAHDKTSITLAWQPASGGLDGISYDLMGPEGLVVEGLATTSYTVRNLSPGTEYRYYVVGRDGTGNISEPSLSMSQETSYDPLLAPSNLRSQPWGSPDTMLTWEPARGGYGGITYEVQIAKAELGSDAVFGKIVQIPILSGISHLLQGLEPGTDYEVRIEARDGKDNRSSTDRLRFNSGYPPLIGPNEFKTSGAIGVTDVPLSWAPASGGDGNYTYEISSLDSYGNETLLARTASTNLKLANLAPDTRYELTVRARDGQDKLSAEAPSITVTTDTYPPNQPANFTVKPSEGADGTTFIVSWNVSEDGAKPIHYDVFDQSGRVVTTTYQTATISGLVGGREYSFHVRARDRKNRHSEPSNRVTVAAARLLPPANLLVSRVDRDRITLEWGNAAGGSGTRHYQIFKNDDSVPIKDNLDEDPTGRNSYAITGLTLGETYTFKVRAIDPVSSLQSDFSVISQKTMIPVTAPVPRVTGHDAGSISLAWDASTGGDGPLEYRIFSGEHEVETTASTSYTITGLRSNTQYEFKVRAFDAVGNESVNPAVVTAKTDAVVTQPQDITVVAVDEASIELSWEPSMDEGANSSDGIRYDILTNDLGAPDERIAWNIRGTKYRLEELEPNKLYTFRVQAHDSQAHWSSPSLPIKHRAGTVPLPAPKDLRVENISRSGVEIAWDHRPVAERGTWYVIETATGTGKNARNDTDETGTFIPYLSEDIADRHTVTLYATDWSGNRSSSTAVSFFPPPIPTTPAVQIIEVDDTRATLAWGGTESQGDIRYEIRINGSGTVGDFTQATQFTVTGLKQNTQYSLGVRAVDSEGISSDWANVDVRTARPGTPSNLPNLRVAAMNDDSVTLAWDPLPSGQRLPQYRILKNRELVQTTNQTHYKIENLSPATHYTFALQEIDGNGQKLSLSRTISIFTDPESSLPLAAPSGLRIVTVTDTSLSIAWDPVSGGTGNITYEIYKDGKLTARRAGQTSHTFDELKPMTRYAFFVKAVDEDQNRSAASDELLHETERGSPERPDRLRIVSSDVTTVNLAWNPPRNAVGTTRYHVYKDDVEVDTVDTAEFALTELEPEHAYRIHVIAEDDRGERSEPSKMLPVKGLSKAPDHHDWMIWQDTESSIDGNDGEGGLTRNLGFVVYDPDQGPAELLSGYRLGYSRLRIALFDGEGRSTFVWFRGYRNQGICLTGTLNSTANCGGNRTAWNIKYVPQDNPELRGVVNGVIRLSGRDADITMWRSEIVIHVKIQSRIENFHIPEVRARTVGFYWDPLLVNPDEQRRITYHLFYDGNGPVRCSAHYGCGLIGLTWGELHTFRVEGLYSRNVVARSDILTVRLPSFPTDEKTWKFAPDQQSEIKGLLTGEHFAERLGFVAFDEKVGETKLLSDQKPGYSVLAIPVKNNRGTINVVKFRGYRHQGSCVNLALNSTSDCAGAQTEWEIKYAPEDNPNLAGGLRGTIRLAARSLQDKEWGAEIAIAVEISSVARNLEAVEIGSSRIGLSWSPAPSPLYSDGDVSYKVYKNGTEIATTNDSHIDIMGLASGQNYAFKVKPWYPENGDNKYAAESNELDVRTLDAAPNRQEWEFTADTKSAIVGTLADAEAKNIGLVALSPDQGPTSLVQLQLGFSLLSIPLRDQLGRTRRIPFLASRLLASANCLLTINSTANCTTSPNAIPGWRIEYPVVPELSEIYTGTIRLAARDWYKQDWRSEVLIDVKIAPAQ
ncbi:fibronectin type III domain-containing protein [Mesorhizobium retamae]|uniref:Fibronectin type III domain-containing protein n=1 Tax=Mesorhizobium retamae TaxID=2912854 RepID=A0ABS9QP12_9HYPH|nr:fibronectin type III domain-containing protein [Mesorhizobium sp. IRAMC:0171]MCG7508446.1 fibronectin type III domain-containing protein [Mesorhizobium sp. IRAMC:0171]